MAEADGVRYGNIVVETGSRIDADTQAAFGAARPRKRTSALLETLLFRPMGKTFAEALTGMPNVGQDEDFDRVEDEAGNDHVSG